MSRIAVKNVGLWFVLLFFSLLLGWFLKIEGFPAAFLVGAMLCGIALSCLDGAHLKLPRKFFYCAQSIIGCTVANSITASILVTISQDWAVMLLIVASTVLAGGLVGWVLTKHHALPGTTAAWGSTPGAASAMIAMAEKYGADPRLVALMQYLRLLVVVLSASIAAHFLLGHGQSAPAPVVWPAFVPELVQHGQAILETLALAVAGGLAGKWLRIPAGAMLIPMVFGAVLRSCGWVDIYLPFWLQAVGSILLGWYVGLGFNRSLLASAFRLLPRLLASAVMLIALCGLSAWLLVMFLHTDPLTAYLATSPGGLDSMVLIAIGSQADIPFVMAVQTMRLFVVILVGPQVARLICRYA